MGLGSGQNLCLSSSVPLGFRSHKHTPSLSSSWLKERKKNRQVGEGGEAGLEKLPCSCSGEEGVLRKKSGRASFVWFCFSGSKCVHVGFCLFVMRMFSENEIWVLGLSHFIACKIRLIIISCFLNFLSERSLGFQLGFLLYVYLRWGCKVLKLFSLLPPEGGFMIPLFVCFIFWLCRGQNLGEEDFHAVMEKKICVVKLLSLLVEI